MSRLWRFTGPPENWITAIGIQNWALNENNRGLWEKNIQPGDTVIFHSTKKSEFSKKTKSSIIGFGYVGSPLSIKKDFWWLQEVREEKNKWPYVVPLKEIYLFSNTRKIDFKWSIQDKTRERIAKEFDSLLSNAVEIAYLEKIAKERDPNFKKFPVNGSASRIRPIYEELILSLGNDLFSLSKTEKNTILETRLAEDVDEKLATLSKEQIFRQAKEFDNSEGASHVVKYGEMKVRKENQVQKRRVAKIEDYTCQVCAFNNRYKKANGKVGWIINVDHIIEKSEGGNEKLNNLWVLCPNCHAKKTCGVIRVDLKNKKVYENNKEIKISDNHLFT